MKELLADAVVAGGGPAGTTTATLLAKAGHDVILVERDHHPRHQIGESLLPSTVHGVCRLLGVWDEVHDAGFVRKRGGSFRWGRDPDPWTFAFSIGQLGDADYAFQVERARFDALLFENARRNGVDAREGLDVIQLLTEGERATGIVVRDAAGEQVAIRAPYVVDASGHGSRLARFAGSRVYSEFFRNVAVYGYFEGATRMPQPNSGNIITSAFEHGWCWFIPLSDELTSVGAVVDHEHAGRIREGREEALMWFVEQCPIVSDHLRPARRATEGMYGKVRVRKDWSYTTETLRAPGLLLTGDAACFIDPVWSSGVHLATYGGVLAARTIASALSGELEEDACLREFERRYRREYQVWYDFVLAFYDMDQAWEGYYWKARSLLATNERANEAFIRLIAGGGTAPTEFFGHRVGAGDSFSELVATAGEGPDGKPGEHPRRLSESGPDAAKLDRARFRESANLMGIGRQAPLFEDGLVASPDGLRWARPQVAAAPAYPS